jgi:nucleoside-diphosphate-sugar epimerase
MVRHEHGEAVPPTRVVVVGAGGFIGATLVAALAARGTPVLPVRRADIDLRGPGAGEALAAHLQPSDSVVLLAALTPDKGRGIEPFMSNIAMGAAFGDALARTTLAHVVYFSSDAVYPMDRGTIDEASCAEPPDLYGMMHLSRELMIKSSTKAPVLVLRPTLVFGAADTHNSYGPNRLRRAAFRDGRISLFGEGEERRDHVYVKDLAALCIRALDHRTSGTLNVATGRSITYAELARAVARQFDRPIEIAGTPRQAPIVHRGFDVTRLIKAFPDHRFTPLEEALAEAHRDMLAGAA